LRIPILRDGAQEWGHTTRVLIIPMVAYGERQTAEDGEEKIEDK